MNRRDFGVAAACALLFAPICKAAEFVKGAFGGQDECPEMKAVMGTKVSTGGPDVDWVPAVGWKAPHDPRLIDLPPGPRGRGSGTFEDFIMRST